MSFVDVLNAYTNFHSQVNWTILVSSSSRRLAKTTASLAKLVADSNFAEFMRKWFAAVSKNYVFYQPDSFWQNYAGSMNYQRVKSA